MNLALLDFQQEYVAQLLQKLTKAKKYVADGDQQAVLLSAPTGSGKTVMLTAAIESILFGAEEWEPEPDAVFLWLSDQPELNQQSRARVLSAASLLSAHKLVTLETDFDQERFDGGHVYFLNTQKLGHDKNLTTASDRRTWTIWQTVQNTADHLGGRFYLIIDEAHRGMNKNKTQASEARTIAQKFLLGEPGVLQPVPLVLGVSATPDRFTDLLAKHGERDVKSVIVDVAKVRESGLLKDQLLVRIPEDNQPSDWSLLRGAADRWLTLRNQWRTYCESQHLPVVEPILVIQVEDAAAGKVSKTDLAQAVAALEEAVGTIKDEQLAHCFQDDRDEQLPMHKIRYLAPSKVAADPTVQFVFFKMALTTGWDCPRAEVMMSFRKAKDATLIAQLVGRMIRSPLARRIEESEVLNEVHLYLPHYDKAGVEAVLDKLRNDADTMPATEVRLEKDTVELTVPAAFTPLLEELHLLPNYRVSTVTKQSNAKRLYKLASMLTSGGLAPKAKEEAIALVVDTLNERRAALATLDPIFQQQLDELENITIKPLRINQLTNVMTEEATETVEVSERNVEDLYREARRRIGDEYALPYMKQCYAPTDPDPYPAKLTLYLLVNHPKVLEKVEAKCKTRLENLWQTHQSAILKLGSSKRAKYEEIRIQAREAEAITLALPAAISVAKESEAPAYAKHLYQDGSGQYQTVLGGWEAPVLEAELATCTAWLRNQPRKPWALAIPYEQGGEKKPAYPDFLFMRPDGLVDIIEPHNPKLTDAWAKAKGMAHFADKHGMVFGRIEMVKVEGEGKHTRIRRLNFQNQSIRDQAKKMNSSTDLDNLYQLQGSV